MAIAVDRLSRRLAVRGIIASSGRELSILVDGDVVPDALLTVDDDDDDDDDGDGPSPQKQEMPSQTSFGS